jgi:hypothetical protein
LTEGHQEADHQDKKGPGGVQIIRKGHVHQIEDRIIEKQQPQPSFLKNKIEQAENRSQNTEDRRKRPAIGPCGLAVVILTPVFSILYSVS